MAWMLRAELEGLLCSLSIMLDDAKHDRLIHYSLILSDACNSSPVFLHFVELGTKILLDTMDINPASLHVFESQYLKCAAAAAVIDEVNLAHVMNVLRIEELIEGYISELSIGMSAKIMLAVLGELRENNLTESIDQRAGVESVASDTDSGPAGSWKGDATLLHALLALIMESGRDRYTYIKELVLSPSITVPRADRGSIDPNRWKRDMLLAENDVSGLAKILGNDLNNGNLDVIGRLKLPPSISAAYARGDPILEGYLQSGSICSIRHRLETLYSDSNSSNNYAQMIRWSVIRQIPRLNRARQLIFTRLLQSLANPPWKGSLWEQNFAGNIKGNTRDTIMKGKLLKILSTAFIESGIRIWCYENEGQRLDLLKTALLPGHISSQLVDILSVPVDRGMVDMPLSNMPQNSEALTEMFNDWKRDFKECESLFDRNFADGNMDIFKKEREPYDIGYLQYPPPMRFSGPRFHLGQPSLGVANEMNFFKNPLLSSSLSRNKFFETVVGLLSRSNNQAQKKHDIVSEEI